MTDHRLTLRRIALPAGANAGYATYGELLLDDAPFCDTLEPLPADLPAGTFPARLYLSPHFGYWLYRIYNVPGHDALEVHRGNFAADTRGCVLVGDSFERAWDPHLERNETVLCNSKTTFDRLMAALAGCEDLELTVEEAP